MTTETTTAATVEWTAKNGEVHCLDTRPEALLALGFCPNERVITPRGLARVIGVNMQGKLYFEVICSSRTLCFDFATKEEFQQAGFHPIRTDEDEAFLAVAAEWTAKDGDVHTIDTRPETTLSLGFHPNERVITMCGLVTLIGVYRNGSLLFQGIHDAKKFVHRPTTNEDLKTRYRAVRTDQDENFLAVAVEWTTKDGRIIFLDTRPETTLALGYHPNERVITPRGLATFKGVDIDGKVVFEGISSASPHCCAQSFLRAGYHPIRTANDEKFLKVAVEWTSKSGLIYTVDTRPQTLLALGFRPNERVITTHGLVTVIGVNVDGRVLLERISNSAPLFCPFTTKEEFEKGGFHPIRTDADENFVAVAVEIMRKDTVATLDTRPEAMLAFGLRPNERVITLDGLATAIGVDIKGRLSFEMVNSSQSTYLYFPHTTKEKIQGAGFRAIRTDAENAFVAQAVEWTARSGGATYLLDTRPETTMSAFGFRPNERVITPQGLAIFIGADISGSVVFERCSNLKAMRYPYTKETMQDCRFRAVRSKAEKKFVDVSREWTLFNEVKVAIYVLIDSRPETLKAHGFLQPDESFYFTSVGPTPSFSVAGIDIDNIIFLNVPDDDELGTVRIGYKTRTELLASGWSILPRASRMAANFANLLVDRATSAPYLPAPSIILTVIKAAQKRVFTRASDRGPAFPAPHASAIIPTKIDKKIHPRATTPVLTAPAPVRTVTLPSGAMYTGMHTRAGQRHGNGTMTSADRSWWYKGQWQQGRPHGSGTLQMGPTAREPAAAAVYEGRWVLGVPHGAGTLRVSGLDGVAGRRYRGRWVHGRRVMTAAEVAAVRVSGGTALVCRRALATTAKEVGKRDQKAKKKAPRPSPPSSVVFATHGEVQQMVAAVAAACSHGTRGEKSTLATTTISSTTAAPVFTPPIPFAITEASPDTRSMSMPTAVQPQGTRTRALRQFLLQ